MGKRANTQAGGRSKRAKADPILAAIAEVITQAADLPDRCRAMLVDMLPFSLSVPLDERHEAQTWVVSTVEQTLNAHKSLLEAAVTSEDARLASLQSSELGLASTVQDAETRLEAQKAVVQNSEQLLADATDAANTALNTLLQSQAAQKDGAANLVCAKEEKATLETVFEAHFQLPMRNGSGPHFKELQSSLKQIKLEVSFLKALPSSCSKAKSDRGSFDEVVLQELEKALNSKIASLAELVAVETPASAVREATVQCSEEDHTSKKGAQKQCADALEAAQKEQVECEAALSGAKQAVEEFQPQVDAITSVADKAKAALTSFDAGPLTGFTNYRNRVGVSPEVAPAGA